MNILHIIRHKGEAYPMQIVAAQKAAGDNVKVLLLHDAVFTCPSDANTFCCEEDAEARGTGCGQKVGYDAIVKMIFEADSVVNW